MKAHTEVVTNYMASDFGTNKLTKFSFCFLGLTNTQH